MDLTASFSERLDELIFEREIGISELAKALNIDLSLIYKYLHRKFLPSLQVAIKLTEYFGCSLDFLLGLSEDDGKPACACDINFYNRFRELMAREGEPKKSKLLKAKLFAKQSLIDWYRGKRIPSLDNLAKLARYFSVTVSYLIGWEN